LELPPSNFIAVSDVLLGEGLKSAVVIHLLLDLRCLFGWDALAELFTLKEALQDKVRPARGRLAGAGFKELFTEGATAEAINGLHILKDAISLLE
jgi:hypothetical protein